jgi:hypothetical protein
MVVKIEILLEKKDETGGEGTNGVVIIRYT